MKPLNIAIVGSGPSGCYTAQFLRKQFIDANIVVLDKLPVPFGLIRYGVAPDHVGTKAVTKQFERMFTQDGVQFIGNVDVGKDISLATLRTHFDWVVLATGLYADKSLGIGGENLPQVYGSGQLTRYFNSHPETAFWQPDLGQKIAIIGNGNVAMDIVRLVLKKETDWQDSEISLGVSSHLSAENVQEIHVVSRSSLQHAKFDTVMIKELSKLGKVACFIIGDDNRVDLPSHAEALCQWQAESVTLPKDSKKVFFHFNCQPQQILGIDKVSGLEYQNQQGDKQILIVNSVITAIGFQESENALWQEKESTVGLSHENGYIGEGLYCVGWLKRGPRGTIPENRKDAKAVVDSMVEKINQQPKANVSQGLAHFYQDLRRNHIEYSDFSHWQAIDQYECAKGKGNRDRQKIQTVNDMMRFLMVNEGEKI